MKLFFFFFLRESSGKETSSARSVSICVACVYCCGRKWTLQGCPCDRHVTSPHVRVLVWPLALQFRGLFLVREATWTVLFATFLKCV
jgi:hypothetical protein